MVPVALLGGYLCEKWGRKPVFTIGFLSLPLRILLLSMTNDPRLVIALQLLDGVGGGIYGVASVAMCSDITYGKGGFNTLMGMMGTALSIGGMLGPLLSGLCEEYLGFQYTFYVYLMISMLAAAIFILGMPETVGDRSPQKAHF
jgi:MFS family permease